MNASSVGRGDAFSAAILFRVSTFAALGVSLIDPLGDLIAVTEAGSVTAGRGNRGDEPAMRSNPLHALVGRLDNSGR